MITEEGDEVPTQLDECLVMEFLPGLSEGALGNSSGRDLFGMNGLEKIIQFILEGALDHVHEEEDYVVERQQPFSNEIFL